MKKAKKILALLLCAVLLVGASVAGTLAYLTDTEDVNNTFTIGKVQIKLDEAVVNAETGVATPERTEKGNTKLLMVPGRTIAKDPTVTVLKGSENCYVRVMVTVDVSAGWTDDTATIGGLTFEPWAEHFADYCLISGEDTPGFNATTWTASEPKITPADKTIEYVLTYKNSDTKDIVKKDATSNTVLPAVFDKVNVPKALTYDELALLKGMKIDVVAHAIQAESFENSIEAWEAFDAPTP